MVIDQYRISKISYIPILSNIHDLYDHFGVIWIDIKIYVFLFKSNSIYGPYSIYCSGYCRMYAVELGWWKAMMNTKSYLDIFGI
jgi:hypothetical protein